MKINIQESLLKLICHALKDLGLDEDFKEEPILDFPTDNRFGDLSTNIALRLSKLIKRPPHEIAKDIIAHIEKKIGLSLGPPLNGSDRPILSGLKGTGKSIPSGLEKDTLAGYIKEIKAEGAGFINFYLDNSYFYEYLQNIIIEGQQALKIDLGKGKNVLIEFVSANPTGPLSVAHARQAAVGDCLVNILDFLGFKVKKEFYLNDEGNQINILGKSVELRARELNGEKIDFPDNHYQGDYIYDIAKRAQEDKTKTEDFGDYAARYILDIIRKELGDFGVIFDCWYSQKALRESGKIDKVLDFLKQKGYLYEQDGALWLNSTQFGDDKDRVVVKSDGSYTYLAPDIAYHQDKYQRKFNWLINLWGPDHHGYISRLKAAVQALGYDPGSLSVIIVQLATIFREGKPVHMSTRRGQYITLREVLDEVGKDASRFFFLMRRTSSHLDFDLEVAKKQTSENPVYYVQYAHARICSILRNRTLKIEFKDADLTLLKAKEELGLAKKLWQFSATLNICLNTQDPSMMTVYLQELSESFHKFYDSCRVLGQDESLTQARLSLIEATRIVVATSLELLGISRPEKM